MPVRPRHTAPLTQRAFGPDLFVALGLLLLVGFGCGSDAIPKRDFVATESYGADVTVQAFRTFAGSRTSVFVGIERCNAPIGAEVTWMTLSVPADATPGDFAIDPTAPADPAPATVTISELTATVGDQALSGYVTLDAIGPDRVAGLADIDFPDGRMAVVLDAHPCL